MIEGHRHEAIIAAHQAMKLAMAPVAPSPSLRAASSAPGIEILALDADLAHPPVTGGKRHFVIGAHARFKAGMLLIDRDAQQFGIAKRRLVARPRWRRNSIRAATVVTEDGR